MSLIRVLRYPLFVFFIVCTLLIPSTIVLGRALPDSHVIAFSTPHPYQSQWQVALLDFRTRIIRIVDQYPWRIPLSLTWSPDGSRLAYATLREPSDIFVHDVQAGQTINVTQTLGDDRYPTWSPDSDRLLFYSNQHTQNQGFDIFSVGADGSNLQQLTVNEALMPAYSPDGSQVVFTSTTRRDLYLMNSNGTDPRPLTESLRNDQSAVWSPDGSRIAFVGLMYGLGQTGQFIFMLDDICLQTTRDPCDPEIAYPDFRFQGMPQWSPDGRYLAFVAQTRRDALDMLYIVDLHGDNIPYKAVENIHFNYGERWSMWSPDSRLIAFSRRDEPGLHVLEVATNVTRQVAPIEAAYPAWQP